MCSKMAATAGLLDKNVLDAGPGHVACDVCTGRKNKAIKSCPECLASYCEADLILHDKLNRGKSHKLIEATNKLQERICSQHHKLLEIYCRTDQQCICYLCMIDEHKHHDTVSSTAEATEKQKELGETQRKFQKRIQEREKELQDLRQAVESLTCSAQAAVKGSERIFTELIYSIKRSRSEARELIRDQENVILSQAERVMEHLKKEIAELRRREAELEQLSHTKDHIHFLQSCQPLSFSAECGDLPSITINPRVSFRFVKKSGSQLKQQVEEICKEKLATISETVKDVHLLPVPRYSTVKGVDLLQAPEPRTRAEFLQYSCQLTLNPNTAYRELCLSEGNRQVTWATPYQYQSCPDHPERFDCRQRLSGHCYWEAEWSGGVVYIAVSYKEVNRKGIRNDCKLGRNDKSWSLQCSPSQYSFYHNNDSTEIPTPSRIGVYLDHEAGTLSFYSISNTMTFLHRVQTTFTQPLYPGFCLNKGSTVKLCPLG
ncbi:hypothetical protein MATL_G00252530 [Megalops atlanticus]|uniref:Tripartite motif-containing protein 16-like n=1 Tax=Megalops atlanticus TaxID=7932 RepID=A0A9D3PCM7_MEGAT|nr:hypothetical protein MATL_G00252530 [Megalops atlanticus]